MSQVGSKSLAKDPGTTGPKKRVLRMLGWLGLVWVVWLTHKQVLPVGLWLHDTDLSMAPVLEGMFREGQWSAFYFQLNYGGTVLTALRAVWMAAYEALIGGVDAHYTGNLLFSTVVIGVLFAGSAYVGVRAYCSEQAAWVVALLAAVGFQSIVYNAGNEFYLAAVLLGPWILSWVARGQSPWTTWTRTELLWRGAIMGLALYTFRASIVYLVPVLLPWWMVRETLAKMFFSREAGQPYGRIHHVLKVLFIGFALFYVFLDLFGPVLGTYNGKPVKLYAEHNSKFVLIAGALLAVWSQRGRLRSVEAREAFKRGAWLGLGLLVGLLPEILYLIGRGFQVPPGGWESQSLRASLEMLPRQLPRLFEYLMVGRNLPPSYDGLLRLLPLLLLMASVWSIVRAGLGFGGVGSKVSVQGLAPVISLRKDEAAIQDLTPVLFAGALLIAAIARVYVSNPAEFRYILPMFPMLLVAIGVLWDRSRSVYITRVWVTFLILGSASFQLMFRSAQVESIQRSGVIDAIFEGVRTFERAGVEVVVSDDYWHSTQYTWVANRKIYFVSNARRLGPEEGFVKAEQAARIGIMLTGRVKPDAENTISWFGGRFKLERLGQAGDAELYVGTRL